MASIARAQQDFQNFTNTRYSNPELWGTEGAYFSGRMNLGSSDSQTEIAPVGSPTVTLNGTQYYRPGHTNAGQYEPFGGGMIFNDQWGSLIPYETQLRMVNSDNDIWDTLGDYGPLLAGAALFAGPVAASMAAGGAGAGAAGMAAGGGSAGGLTQAQIAQIIAAEGGYSALPSFGMAGTAVTGAGGATTGGLGMEELIKKALGLGGSNPLGNIFNIGRGIYGMMQADDLKELGMRASQQENPFGPYRDEYALKLRALYNDPSSITKMPGYDAGLTAVERKMASQGYLGSGNMMAALQKYGGDFFNAEADRLATLAGAKFAPGGGNQMLSGGIAGTQLSGNALNSLIYGALGMGADGVFGGSGSRAPGSTPGINGGALTRDDLMRIIAQIDMGV
jgi:hypothetical protein